MASNPIVHLSPNSLYISTRQIFGRAGAYHWAIYVTDNTGLATEYHWAVLPPATGKAEGVIISTIGQVATYTREWIVTFGFFRIGEFKPPFEQYMEELVQNVFEAPHAKGYSTVLENRYNGLTCRTWVMTVYATLQASGQITRQETRDEIEAIIKRKTAELEAKVAVGELDVSGHEDI